MSPKQDYVGIFLHNVWAIDHPVNMLTALVCGLLMGFFFLGRAYLPRPGFYVVHFLLSVMVIQIAMTIAWALRGFALSALLVFFFWLPIWGIFALGQWLGMRLCEWRRQRRIRKALRPPCSV